MRLTSKFLSAVFILITACSISFAQTPDFRNKGYKGSASIIDLLGVFLGAETSHGYMFDSHNYLGAGVSGFFLLGDQNPFYLNFFADYQHYFGNKKSAPVLAFKAGYSRAVNYDTFFEVTYKNGVLLEPSFGWNWGFKSGKGLTFSLGCSSVIPVGESRTSRKILPLPKIALAFEF